MTKPERIFEVGSFVKLSRSAMEQHHELSFYNDDLRKKDHARMKELEQWIGTNPLEVVGGDHMAVTVQTPDSGARVFFTYFFEEA